MTNANLLEEVARDINGNLIEIIEVLQSREDLRERVSGLEETLMLERRGVELANKLISAHTKELKDERDEAKEDYKRVLKLGEELRDEIEERHALNVKLTAENKRLREALEFYADSKNYVIHESTDREIEYWFHVHFDEGDKARRALEQSK